MKKSGMPWWGIPVKSYGVVLVQPEGIPLIPIQAKGVAGNSDASTIAVDWNIPR